MRSSRPSAASRRETRHRHPAGTRETTARIGSAVEAPLRSLATLLVIVHAIFVAFVVFGSSVVLRWHRAIWLHVPAVMWGVLIEVTGWTCPLTPLENALRARAGETGYHGGFIEHYLLRVLYPIGLTRTAQWGLGGAALLINVVAYGWVLTHRRGHAWRSD